MNLDKDYKIDADEIDIFKLGSKIWKWKWLTLLLIILSSLIIYIKINSMPDTYTSSALLKIGKVANFEIEENSDIIDYLKTSEFIEGDSCLSKISYNGGSLSIITDSSDKSYTCLKLAVEKILKRHNLIYNKAVSEMRKNIQQLQTKVVIKPEYILDTYTYPTKIISLPQKSLSPDSKNLKLKMSVAIITALFIGIFLSLFIDFVSSEYKKKKLDSDSSV